MIRFSVPCQIVLVQHFVWKTKNESYFFWRSVVIGFGVGMGGKSEKNTKPRV